MRGFIFKRTDSPRLSGRILWNGSGQGSGATPLVLVVLAASIPILLFAGWVAYRAADQQRNSAREVARAAVERVSERVSASITAEVEVAETLALSMALDRPDIVTFYREALRLTESRPLWHTVELNDLSGSQILNVLRPLGGPLARTADRDSFERAVKEGRSVVGGVGPVGSISGMRLVALRVPVLRDGELRYILTVALDPQTVGSVLREAGVPDGWIGAVADGSGNLIARSMSEEGTVGQPGSPALRDAIKRWSGGFYTGRTLEGVEVETVFKILPNIGNWSVHLGVPSEVLEGPIRRSLYVLIGGVIASLALAGGLGVVVSREITKQRLEQEGRASVALRASEERAALATEAAELGTWRWDLRAGRVTGSERFRALLGLPRVGTSEPYWSSASLLEVIHTDDRSRFSESALLCVQTDRPFDMEFRVVEQSGALRWIRARGRAQDANADAKRDILGVVADSTPRKRAEAERLDFLKRLAEAQEDVQRRIARELHDQIGQTVTGLSLGLKGLERAMDSKANTPDLLEQVQWLQKLSGEIGRDIHRAAADLRPTALDDLGLSRALAAHAADWSKRYGVEVDVQIVGAITRASSELETTVFRIVQEALTNVLKHAGATQVSVVLEWRPRELRLVIEDDGRGFDQQPGRQPDALAADTHPMASRHLGLSGIRERLALIDGTLGVESAPGVGSSLFVQIPLDAAPTRPMRHD